MTGLLAYGHEDFSKIDELTIAVLKKGLAVPALQKLVHPKRSLQLLLVFLASTLPMMVLAAIRRLAVACARVFDPSDKGLTHWIRSLRWPVPRWYSRTHVFSDVISDLVGNGFCDQPTRQNKKVVFNACELRTGTAFRISNEGYGSWRYGYGKSSEMKIADAITASAAYPPLLPPFDWTRELEKDGNIEKARLIVTDGGVYENVGVSVMEPGRNTSFSGISYSPQIIIASDAGMGQFTGNDLPVTWPTRMIQVVNSVMRKVNDATKARLHSFAESGQLKRFIYVNLGQIDDQVPIKSVNWISRSSVLDYPTNFSAMTEDDIGRISGRAETLTRSLLTQYFLAD